jgi:cyclopropane fatty-acyl-phospholipid synthase-like methyltransferase
MKGVVSLALTILALAVFGSVSADSSKEEIPYVPTPMEVIDRMLEMAEVGKDDVVYDLGSGDGRIVIRAAKKFGVRGVGIEMDAKLIELSKRKARKEGVSHLVEFRAEDALKTDISPATVVTLYMFPWFNNMMRPVLQQTLKPGARVVSHDFDIEGWEADKVEQTPHVENLTGGHVHRHILFLWKIR